MSWQILLTISIITYSVSILLQRVLLREDESDPVAYSIIFQVLVGLVIATFALYQGFYLPNLTAFLPNLFLMTVLYALANIFIFNSLKISDASEFTIVFSTRAVWTVLAAMIFLGETFSLRQALGSLLIMTSIVLVSIKKTGLKFTKGSVFSMMGACFLGLAFTNDAFIIKNADVAVSSYLVIALLVPAIAVLLIKPQSISKMKPLLRKQMLSKLLILAFFYAISALSVFAAYQVGRNAAQIGSLGNLTTILIVLLSIIFLKERSNLVQKLAGAVLSFVGLLLI